VETRVFAPEGPEHASDMLSIEEPLEIRLVYWVRGERIEQSVSVTMRTPGDDVELAVGFLAGEGIVDDAGDIVEVAHAAAPVPDSGIGNIVRVELAEHVDVDAGGLLRNFYTASSCGVCGKASLEAIHMQITPREQQPFSISSDLLRGLPQALSAVQSEFALTGGLHAAAAFDERGAIARVREDVGRHNALDKLTGSYFAQGGMQGLCVLLSGRTSFELLQKAAMAGIPLIAAIGPPSSLALELAREYDITLIGFLKADRFNVYCGSSRIANS
jgi:FdhD protein|tara:strand:+ start:289 stop:1107 length:819 start_codon:yes stop_codon:yes gene_type:complete